MTDYREFIETLGRKDINYLIGIISETTENVVELQVFFERTTSGRVNEIDLHSAAAKWIGTKIGAEPAAWNGAAFLHAREFRNMLNNVVAEHMHDTSVFNNQKFRDAVSKLNSVVNTTARIYEAAMSVPKSR